jgi:DNA-binding GntR family transcriptional regulator
MRTAWLIVDQKVDNTVGAITASVFSLNSMPNKVIPKRAKAAARTEGSSVHETIDWIRERIRRGRFVPGQRLVEADIIRELGTSRSKVREALQRLSTEGLVTIEEFRGASVKTFSRDEVRQIYRVRMALEGLAAGDFAAADAPALKSRLAKIQADLNAIEHTGDHERFARLNDEWHRLIIEGSGNEYVKMFVDRLRVPIYRLLFSTFYNARRIDKANAGHRRITDAIVAGRVKEAERFMKEHIAEGLEALSDIEAEFE